MIVYGYMMLLNQHQGEFIRFPGYYGIERNEKTDECTLIETSLEETMTFKDFLKL